MRILIALCALCMVVGTTAQTASPILPLPPLDTVIALAMQHSPVLAQHDALVEKTSYDVKRVKRSIFDIVKFSANYRFGVFGNEVVNKIETGYNLGPSVSFSLYDVGGYRSLVNVFRAENKIAVHKREESVLELRKLVTLLYNSARTQASILQIKSEALQSTLVHMKMAETEFTNGTIPVSEVSRVAEIYNKARTEMELAIHDLRNTYDQLELLAGVSFSPANNQ